MERLGAGHVVQYLTVGQEPDERHEELTGVGNSCHERGLERRPSARQQLHFALPAYDDHHMESVGHRGNAGEGEGLGGFLEFGPPAKSRAPGLMQKPLAFEFISDTASIVWQRVPEAQACYRHRHPGRGEVRRVDMLRHPDARVPARPRSERRCRTPPEP